MSTPEFAPGQDCWIFCGETTDGRPSLSKGRVMFGFKLPDCPLEFYCIKIDDPEWMHLEIRDALLMSGSPDRFPAYVKRTNPHGNLVDFQLDGFDVVDPEGDDA